MDANKAEKVAFYSVSAVVALAVVVTSAVSAVEDIKLKRAARRTLELQQSLYADINDTLDELS